MIELKQAIKVIESKKSSVIGVDHVDLTINRGEIYGIVGYSGAGKSTLLRCINLLERPTSGSVIIDGVDLLKLSNPNLRKMRQSVGMIFQGFHLFSTKTVAENVDFSLKVAEIGRASCRERV